MPIAKSKLEQLMKDAFPEASIEVRSLTGDEDHYEVTVKATEFLGKSRIVQHKMVQEAVKGYDIHALSIKTSV